MKQPRSGQNAHGQPASGAAMHPSHPGVVVQIVTLNDEHHCVPRRDNKLVTSRVIAQKYGNLMNTNPTWKMSSIKQTVLEEMMADVSITKCKRDRKLMFDQLFDRTVGEYSNVFNYQKELLRSNLGSTVAVKLDPGAEVDKHVFQRFYVCLKHVKEALLHVVGR